MKKIFLPLLFLFLFVSCRSNIAWNTVDCETDKKIYYSGENVKITYSGLCNYDSEDEEIVIKNRLFRADSVNGQYKKYKMTVKNTSTKSKYSTSTDFNNFYIQCPTSLCFYLGFDESLTIGDLEPGFYELRVTIMLYTESPNNDEYKKNYVLNFEVR